MIKVFTTNKAGKIELTKEELKDLLNEVYWDGYKANSHTYVYNTPLWAPYTITCNGTTADVTISASDITSGTIITGDKNEPKKTSGGLGYAFNW